MWYGGTARTCLRDQQRTACHDFLLGNFGYAFPSYRAVLTHADLPRKLTEFYNSYSQAIQPHRFAAMCRHLCRNPEFDEDVE